MPKYLPKRKKRSYRRPKWGFRPPAMLKPHPDSAAAKRHKMPRAFARRAFISFSNRKLEKTAKYWEHRGGFVGLVVRRVLSFLGYKRWQSKKPPKVEKHYTVEVG